MIPENIFRAYDIRGTDKDLTKEVAEKIGKSFATFIGEGKTIVVGRDGRLNADELHDAFVSGLISCGCNVVDVDRVTSPILYFSVPKLRADAGVMITASHNPKNWNGFKLCDNTGIVYHGDTIQKLKDIILQNKFNNSENEGKTIFYDEIFDDYTRFVLGKITSDKKLKVVLDVGNGVGGLVAPSIFKKLGHETVVINQQLDGEFPGRGPDPTAEGALTKLKETVLSNKADLGIAYDGDADRVSFVDNNGQELRSGNVTIMILSRHLLNKHPNSKIVFDVCCSSAVEDYIKQSGGVPIIERVGHAFITERMAQEQAIFAGEYSNHFYFLEVPGFDDAIFCSLRMAELLSNSEKKLSSLIDEIPQYFYKFDWAFECPDDKKSNVIEKMKGKFRKLGYNFSELDGIKLYFDKDWIVWRISNTRPLVLIFLEARTKEKFEELERFAEKELIEAMK